MQSEPKLLLIDDQKCMLHLVRTLLVRSGFEVIATSCATEALEIILNQKALFMVLTDYDMPVMKGTELLMYARTFRPEALRVLTSGGLDECEAEIFIQNGVCEHFIAKPWKSTQLIDFVTDGLLLYKSRANNVVSNIFKEQK